MIMNKILTLLGAVALTFTLATAEMKCEAGKCGADAKKMMKDAKGSGAKCSNATKEAKDTPKMKCAEGKCGTGMKKEVPKPAPAKGKCGQGKCG